MQHGPPPFVDDNGQFVDADFRCEKCGAVVNVVFHPDFLNDLGKVQRWLEANRPCSCRPPAAE